MSKENIYTGAAAELFVANVLTTNQWGVFVKTVDCDADLLALRPCNHTISIQVKVAYEGRSFHAGKYKNIDYYAIVYWDRDTMGREVICWVPCYEVEADSHASLTQDWKMVYTSYVPEQKCKICESS